MIRKTMTVMFCLALAAGLVVVLPASAEPSTPLASTTIVISEFRTRGLDGATDEFIELFNLSSNTVAISGWELWGSNSSGTASMRATVPANTSIGPGCRYLITHTGYTGSTTADLTYTGSTNAVTDNGGIAICNGPCSTSSNIIDQVGMSTGSAYKEGTPLTPMSVNQDQSYERKSVGVNTTDTDNNASDFLLNSVTSNPQNSSSSCTPLAVTLAGFSATQQGDAILVTWETASELSNLGFNLYRATSPAGPATQLNTALIPSQAPGSTTGFLYSWQDQVGLIAGQTYYYWLEDVDLSGATTLHGPVSVDFGAPTAVRLSGVSANPAVPVALPLAGTVLALLASLTGALAVRWRA